ncbi:MAG TPA: ATP-binding protein [bacterium]|nr:ATP-binding protein [bacterium]
MSPEFSRGLKPEEFGTRSVTRNPNVVSLLHRLGLIEKMGTGINRMRNWMAEAGLEPPVFGFISFFTVTFLRPPQVTQVRAVGGHRRIRDAVDDTVSDAVSDTVKARLVTELLHVVEQGATTIADVMRLGLTSRATAKRDLHLLKQTGLLQFSGPPKTGTYVLTDKGKALLKEFGR